MHKVLANGFRVGMWLVRDGVVGILVRNLGAKQYEFHVVDEKGQTSLVIPLSDSLGMRQALRAEIPAPRRPAPGRAKQFGYK